MADTGGAFRATPVVERYLVGTVTDSPPSAVSEEYAAQPGFPVPGANNVATGVSVTLSGRGYRSTNAPTIEVSAQDLGRVPTGISDAVEAVLAGTGGDITSLIKEIASNLRGAAVTPKTVQVPRVGIQRTNNDLGDDPLGASGVTQDFNRWPNASTVVSVPGTTPGVEFNYAKMVEMSDLTWRLIVSGSIPATPLSSALYVYKFDPAADTAWQLLTLQTVGATDGVPNIGDVAPVVVGTDVYIICGANEANAATGFTYGKIYVYRCPLVPSGSINGLIKISGPVYISDITHASTPLGRIAATMLGDTCMLAADVQSIGTGPTVGLAYSPDFRNWGGRDTEHARVLTLSDFAATVFNTSADARTRETVKDIHFVSATAGWFCTDEGRIFATADAGVTWTEQDSPVARKNMARGQLPLYRIYAVSTSLVFAAGADGVILKGTVTAGVMTWKVLRYAGTLKDAIDDDAWTSAADKADATWSSFGSWFGLTFDTSSRGYVAGQNGIILRTTDGGTTWTVLSRLGPGTYRDLISDHGASPTIWACGDADVHGASSTSTTKPMRMVKITAAHTVAAASGGGAYESPNATYALPIGSSLVALTRPDATVMYAVTSDGFVYRNLADTLWVAQVQLQATATDIFAPASSPASVFITGDNGIWRSVNGTVAAPNRPTFFAQQLVTNRNESMWFFDASIGLVGGRGTVLRTTVTFDQRSLPTLATLVDGAVVLGCNNLTQAFSELYRITGPLSASPQTTLVDRAHRYDTPSGGFGLPSATRTVTGELIISLSNGPPPPILAEGTATGLTGTFLYATAVKDAASGNEGPRSKTTAITVTSKKVGLTFVAAGGSNTTEIYRADGYGKPLYFLASVTAAVTTYTDDNTVATLMNRTAPPHAGARVCPTGDGVRWTWPDDAALAIPFGAITPDQTWTAGERDSLRMRSICAVRGGRIVANLALADRVVTWVTRDWVPQTTATGPTQFMPVYPGVPIWLVDALYVTLVGTPMPKDKWTITAASRYPRQHLGRDSPQVYWRSKDNTGNPSVTWDREAAETIAARGAGGLWSCAGFALFGTNFKTLIAGLSAGTSPTSGLATVLSDPPGAREKQISATVYAASFTGGVGGDVGLDANAKWIPDQWAPGLATYYVEFGAGSEICKIVGNSETVLYLERAAGATTIAALTPYEIFIDRFWWDGSGLTNGTDLNNGTNMLGRVARIRINSAGAGGYRKIGTACIGLYTSATVPTGVGAEATAVHGYGDEARWKPIVNTLEQTGPGGVSHVAHIGELGEVWQLPADHQEWWQRDRLLNPLLRDKRARRAFTVIFDTSRLSSVQLVRLVDTPEFVNTVRDRYQWPWVLRRVV